MNKGDRVKVIGPIDGWNMAPSLIGRDGTVLGETPYNGYLEVLLDGDKPDDYCVFDPRELAEVE